MIKYLISSFLLISSLSANSFYFSEERYSDAIGRSIEFKGEITFLENSLEINYTDINKSLKYSDDILVYMQDEKIIELDSSQSKNIIEYFKVLILLHSDDDSKLHFLFEIQTEDSTTVLIPKTYIKEFIKKIELKKNIKELKYIKLFLKNGDTIGIKIEDEIQ